MCTPDGSRNSGRRLTDNDPGGDGAMTDENKDIQNGWLLAFVREIKDDVKALNIKMDNMTQDRHAEAYEKGKYDARLEGLEQRFDRSETRHAGTRQWLFALIGTLIAAAIIAGSAFGLKMFAAHPEISVSK